MANSAGACDVGRGVGVGIGIGSYDLLYMRLTSKWSKVCDCGCDFAKNSDCYGNDRNK